MSTINTLDLLDKAIAFHPALVPVTGSINAALMLSQAKYWTRRATLPGGWFYKTQAEWQEETGMTRREQDGARKLLLSKGFIKEERRGVPGRLHYQVQLEALRLLLGSYAPNRQTECTKPPNLFGGNRQCNSENTHVTTPEKQQQSVVAVGTMLPAVIVAAKPVKVVEAFELPAWIDREAWDGFVEMRELSKKPLSPRGCKLLVRDLERWARNGHDPIKILDTSTSRGWTGLFEPEGGNDGAGSRKSGKNGHLRFGTKSDATAANAADSARSLDAGFVGPWGSAADGGL